MVGIRDGRAALTALLLEAWRAGITQYAGAARAGHLAEAAWVRPMAEESDEERDEPEDDYKKRGADKEKE